MVQVATLVLCFVNFFYNLNILLYLHTTYSFTIHQILDQLLAELWQIRGPGIRNVQILCFNLLSVIIINYNDNNDGNEKKIQRKYINIHRAKNRLWFPNECFSPFRSPLGNHNTYIEYSGWEDWRN